MTGAQVETSDYKEIFLTEAREYLSTLNNALVTLEKDPSQAESINEIFRAAHTLKGMSATMGYEPMAQLTHQMETVLEPIRSGSKQLTPQLMDALFICLDQLEKWVGILSSQDSLEEKDLQATLQTLQQAAETLRQASSESSSSSQRLEGGRLSFTQEEKDVLSQARMNGFSVFRVMVDLAEECAFKEVRAFMILRNVNELGEIVKSHPSPEEVEKGLFGRGFILVVVTDSTEEKLRRPASIKRRGTGGYFG
jgi:two-component system chemotaxis sensor kinase CheA